MRLCILSSRGKTAIPPRGRDTGLGLKNRTPEPQCKWCWLVPWNVNGHFIWKSNYYKLKTSGARVCNSFRRLLVFLRGPGQSLLRTPQLACRSCYIPLDCLQQRYHVVARWTAGPEYPALFGLPLAVKTLTNLSLKLTPRPIKGRLRKEILNSQEISHLKKERKWSRSVCPKLCDPMDSSLHQAPPSMGFSRHEYWSGLPLPSPSNLPDPGIEPRSPSLRDRHFPVWATWEVIWGERERIIYLTSLKWPYLHPNILEAFIPVMGLLILAFPSPSLRTSLSISALQKLNDRIYVPHSTCIQLLNHMLLLLLLLSRFSRVWLCATP